MALSLLLDVDGWEQAQRLAGAFVAGYSSPEPRRSYRSRLRARVCLLGLNGLRISEACRAEVDDLAGSRYQPTLRIVGKGDKPAEVVLNPRSQHAMDQAIDGRAGGPLLLNRPGNRMQRHNVAALLVGWHATPGSTST